MRTIDTDETTVVKTRQELFSWLATRAKSSGGIRPIPKSLLRLFDNIMTSMADHGTWTRQGCKSNLRFLLAHPSPEAEYLPSGAEVLRVLHDLVRHCVEREGRCEISSFAAISDALGAIGAAEMSYELLGDRIHMNSSSFFNQTEPVMIDVWLDAPPLGDTVTYRREDDHVGRVRFAHIYPPHSASRHRPT